ncbi:MarR family transcriptional regulator [Couchioplanes caeruleus]|uniref:MarR family winged helix-turn-helix transcriptional regulator n=1 Tax=Couchioplanes caeruleus TaxID=56438 RepID=UPI0020C012FE|nr:MarR family transcriptional regulator [Couchioplanes caeruleus]UQU62712.1 MarR family transcriptional regulator [Couchioplanes caeruleus]
MHDDDTSPAGQIHAAFTRLMRWAQRGDVRRLLMGSAAEELSMHDITLLRAISTHGPVRGSDLATWQGVDKSTVTPQVRRLEDRGLVTREGDPGDRRAALLTVTDQGRRRLRETDDSGVVLFERALDGWSDDDRRVLAELMTRLAGELALVPAASVLHTRRRA